MGGSFRKGFLQGLLLEMFHRRVEIEKQDFRKKEVS